MVSYLYITNDFMHETIVNRSRFLCYLFPCSDDATFKLRLKQLQLEHPSANHHCYAFVAGAPSNGQMYGFSDDGEPSGTAGKPMLAMLQGSDIGHIGAIVVRYFGGVKLGTGGLQRAYGGAVREALAFVETAVKVPMSTRTLTCNYQQVKDIQHLVKQTESEISQEDYQENVKFVLAIPDDQLKLFEQQLLTLSGGSLTLDKLDTDKPS